MTANISNPDHCDEDCERGYYPQGEGWTPHSQYDVRYCRHMRIWLCTGNSNRHVWIATGFWRRLSWWWDPFTYRLAKRKLESLRG